MTRPTYAAIAVDFDLWLEYIDTAGTMSRDEFNAMTTADRIALIIDTFGPEPEQAPTIEDLLEHTSVGNGFHDWAIEGGVIRVTADQLRHALEAAYDPDMPNWVALVELPDA